MNLLHKLYYGTPKPQSKQPTVKKQLNSTIVLPGHIGSRILDLQLELQAKNMTKESAEELLSLYSEAVQFYEAKHDPKYRNYKNRIQSLLSNQEVYTLMFGEKRPTKMKQKDIQEVRQGAEKNARQQAKVLLQNYKKEQQKHTELINRDVEWQNQRINDRLRRRSTLNKSSFSFSSTLIDSTLDDPQPEIQRVKEI